MARETHRLQETLEQVEAVEQRLDRLAASAAGTAEFAEAIGQLGAAWAEAHHAAVEACHSDQPSPLRERRRLRGTVARASIR